MRALARVGAGVPKPYDSFTAADVRRRAAVLRKAATVEVAQPLRDSAGTEMSIRRNPNLTPVWITCGLRVIRPGIDKGHANYSCSIAPVSRFGTAEIQRLAPMAAGRRVSDSAGDRSVNPYVSTTSNGLWPDGRVDHSAAHPCDVSQSTDSWSNASRYLSITARIAWRAASVSGCTSSSTLNNTRRDASGASLKPGRTGATSPGRPIGPSQGHHRIIGESARSGRLQRRLSHVRAVVDYFAVATERSSRFRA